MYREKISLLCYISLFSFATISPMYQYGGFETSAYSIKDKQNKLTKEGLKETLLQAIAEADTGRISMLSHYICEEMGWHQMLHAAFTQKYNRSPIEEASARNLVVDCCLQMLDTDIDLCSYDPRRNRYVTDREKQKKFLNIPFDCEYYKAPILHLAVSKGYNGIVDRLIRRGVDIFAMDTVGETAFHRLLKSKEIKRDMERRVIADHIIKYIYELCEALKRNSNLDELERKNLFLNAKTIYGEKGEKVTALQLAIHLGQVFIAEELLYLGADPFCKFEGKTILLEALLTPNITKDSVRKKLVEKVIMHIDNCESRAKKKEFYAATVKLTEYNNEAISALDLACKKGYTDTFGAIALSIHNIQDNFYET